MSFLLPAIRKLRANAPGRKEPRGNWAPALLILAAALVMLILAFAQDAYAATVEAGGLDNPETCVANADCGPQYDTANVNAEYGDSLTMADLRPASPVHPGNPHAAAQEGESDPTNIPVWMATMTVGKSNVASIGYLGFVAGDWPDTGSIDNVSFSHAGVDYMVTALYHPIVTGNPNHLFLHLDMPLGSGWTLRVGQDSFDLSNAQVWGAKRNIYHWYLADRMDWAVGDEVPIALTAPDDPDIFHGALAQRITPTVG